jgi:hypothetical protein
MQPATPLTYLTTVTGSFHAKVLVARLGTEGIPAQLRGAVDGLYPIFAEVRIYVRADQVDAAREVLLADAVDAVFQEAADEQAGARKRRAGTGEGGSERDPRRMLLLVTLAIVVVLVVVGTLAAGTGI